MYAISTPSTTSGSGRALSGAARAPEDRRMRVVRLMRPRRASPAFGFSLRGGKEYAAGFFISKVEFSSEAHLHGLKVGDQLVSVNGYRVDDAVHSELVHYLASQSRLKIKVRHVGMLPVKEKVHEPMSWQFVSERASLCSDVSSSPTLCHDAERMADLRLSILVPPSAKLGCGICKGPEWKPGIFVQFVREGGIAREAGLRPGDQILACNGLDFTSVTFNEAVSAMKATGRLELIIREGAGAELVSPESSGYNSSASSAAGERSPASATNPVPLAPPAALRRRLASVAEEAADRADRLTLSKLKRRTWDSLDWKNTDIHNFDAPSDIEPDYDSPSIPNNPHTFENKNKNRNKQFSCLQDKNKRDFSPKSSSEKNKKEFITSPSNRTIINLTEDGATIQCSYDNQTPRFSTNRNNDKKTIVVEVHHTSGPAATCGKTSCSVPPPMKETNSDTTSVGSSATLSSAIAEEFQKRLLKKKNSCPENSLPTNTIKKPPPKPMETDKKKQVHDALMDEFKKVHRKMFLSQESENKDNSERCEDTENIDRQTTLPLRRPEPVTNGAANGHPQPKPPATDSAPPPPPMPTTNGHQNGDCKVAADLNQIIAPVGLKAPNFRKNGLTRTPTPDYNNLESTLIRKVKDDKAELDSLESYKLKNPLNVAPKPPPNYFVRAPNGTATMKKHTRPVSVTIGEYVNGTTRREPTKLEFLNGDKPDGPVLKDIDEETSISNRLQSELVMTLSRSNLRKKTEALERRVFDHKASNVVIFNDDSDSSMDKNFHARYGNNILPLPPSVNIPKVSKTLHKITAN